MTTHYVVERESRTHVVTASIVTVADLTGAALVQDDVVTVVPQDVAPRSSMTSRKKP